jgi:hypothetical protein
VNHGFAIDTAIATAMSLPGDASPNARTAPRTNSIVTDANIYFTCHPADPAAISHRGDRP